jgi:hypothetical protein
MKIKGWVTNLSSGYYFTSVGVIEDIMPDYKPATLEIEDEPELNAHIAEPLRGILNSFFNDIKNLKEA